MAGAGGERRSNIVVVDDDVADREVLTAAVTTRYSGAYGVVVESSANEALRALEAMQRIGQRVSVVLVRQWMAEMTGAEVAAVLGCSESTVWSRIYSAHRELRKKLSSLHE